MASSAAKAPRLVPMAVRRTPSGRTRDVGVLTVGTLYRALLMPMLRDIRGTSLLPLNHADVPGSRADAAAGRAVRSRRPAAGAVVQEAGWPPRVRRRRGRALRSAPPAAGCAAGWPVPSRGSCGACASGVLVSRPLRVRRRTLARSRGAAVSWSPLPSVPRPPSGCPRRPAVQRRRGPAPPAAAAAAPALRVPRALRGRGGLPPGLADVLDVLGTRPARCRMACGRVPVADRGMPSSVKRCSDVGTSRSARPGPGRGPRR